VTEAIAGANALMRRFKALQKDVFVPEARLWQDEAVKIARATVPNRDTRWSKGKLHDSIRARKSRAVSKIVVVGFYTGYFVDAGVKPHSLKSRKSRPTGAARTIFAAAARKQHPGYPARPWRGHATAEALARHPVFDVVIDAWNKAA
jgi:hypothetical protein